MGYGQLPVDPVVAPPVLVPASDAGFRSFLQSRGLVQPDVTADTVAVEERSRDVAVQTVDPRIISPSEFIIYRQSFDTLTAATHMALLVRGCISMDATALADLTAIRLGLPASDLPSWDALYRMAVTAAVVERQLQCVWWRFLLRQRPTVRVLWLSPASSLTFKRISVVHWTSTATWG